MRFGKIRVENDELRFSRMMKSYVIPCGDIRWAYCQRERHGGKSAAAFVVILTKKEKRYQFEMTEEEAKICLKYLKECSPELITGFPGGAPLPLRSVSNTRDLGGLATKDGRHILPGQLLRSGDLYHLSQEDIRVLRDDYHLAAVVDFRTEQERLQKPDSPIEGSTYIAHPIFDEELAGISREKELPDILFGMKENTETYMMSMYQRLVLDRGCRHQYAKFFQLLIDNEPGHAILWHCSAGKDRAGVASMLLLYALGVPRDVIFDDYLRTNVCIEKELEYFARLLEWKGVSGEYIENMRAMLSARESYLQTAIRTIEADCGSMERYLYRVMCLTARNLNKLRNRYLVG